MKKLKSVITLPMALVVCAGAACFVSILLWAPADAKDFLFGANGLVWAAVSYFLRSPSEQGQEDRLP